MHPDIIILDEPADEVVLFHEGKVLMQKRNPGFRSAVFQKI